RDLRPWGRAWLSRTRPRCPRFVEEAADPSTVDYPRLMRTLHPAYRVTDLGASVVFYTALGYGQVGRVDLGEGASLTMLKFPSDEFVALELVHRPGDGPVDIGTGFSHLAVQIDNLKANVA